MARDLAEVVGAANVVVGAVGGAIRLRVEMASIVRLVVVRQRARRFGHSTSRPPSADRSGDASDQRSERPGRRPDSRAEEHARDAAGGFSQLIGVAWVIIVRTESGILCPLDAAVHGIVAAIALPAHACPRDR